jgi:predicted phage terminase large subunit-like protein
LKNKFNSITPAQNEIFFGKDLKKFNIFPKGRRLGATHGGAIAHIKWMLEGDACLWGDTINSNIDRYVERYFKPFLKANKIDFKWNVQKKLMNVGDGYTDFRSSDNPENWEGFGYKKIFLNEAGIILDDEYLYYNAVLPIMLDEPDSVLIAAGTPKLLRGRGRLFYDLQKKALDGDPDYHTRTFSTYDNIFLDKKHINKLEMSIPSNERQQEIYGKMMLEAGSLIEMAWFKRFDAKPEFPERIIQSWDTASKDKEVNDPSVCTTWLETYGKYYLVDVFKENLKYPDLKRSVSNLAAKWSSDVILIEDKSSGIALIQDLRNDRFPYNILAVNPVSDKVTRMSTASLTIEAGRVYLPNNKKWLADFEAELLGFPNGEHDDQVDSVSQFLNWVKKPSEIFIG